MGSKATVLIAKQRVDDVVRLRLEGYEGRDVIQYVAEKEKSNEDNCWKRDPGEPPLCERAIWIYIRKADDCIISDYEVSRKRMLRRDMGKRSRLYQLALKSGDLATALRVLQDAAKLRGLYPAEKREHSGPKGAPIEFIRIVDASSTSVPPSEE